MPTTDTPEPWALLPSEVVCATCHLAHHKHLPECPTCKLEDRT
jgi:hypothetical protein